MISQRLESVAIVGVGMIGGSIASSLRQRGVFVKGFARREETIKEALALGVIDEGSTKLENVVNQVDLVIVSVPIEFVVQTIVKVDSVLLNPTIVSDVSSVKHIIMSQLRSTKLMKAIFVGGHPMAGSEKMGVMNYKQSLFSGKPYILCYPSDEVKIKAQDLLSEYISTLGANKIELTSEQHDYAVAQISHMPYLISSALWQHVDSVPEFAKSLISSGFKDTTRIAHSDPWWGVTVGASNAGNLETALDAYIRCLNRLKKAIQDKDWTTFFNLVNIENIEVSEQRLALITELFSKNSNV